VVTLSFDEEELTVVWQTINVEHEVTIVYQHIQQLQE
jgi:hypothetical protein